MIFKLAWRNLWRNKRRTLITMASVFFAVVLSSVMRSFQEGSYDGMIDAMVGSYTGYGQIHAKDYWEDKTVDNALILTDSLLLSLKDTKGVLDYLPRVESFAMVVTGAEVKGALVVGIDVAKETRYTHLNERISEGLYLKPKEKGAIIGNGLAKQLKVTIGDTLVLMGQGFHGSTAAGKFQIKGIVKYGSPELSKQLVFIPLIEAQQMYGLEEMATSLIVVFDNPDNAVHVISKLKKKLPPTYEAMDWLELVPDLISMIEADRVGGYVFMFILYMVISFGMFGTGIMMLMERQHEFGIMVSIGMKRTKLALMVWIEIMLISLMGAAAGILGALPVSWYFNWNPIQFGADAADMMEEYGMEAVIKSSTDPMIFIYQAIIIAIISLVISIYPFVSLTKLKAINAMKR